MLGENGRQLVQWPVKEAEQLRSKQVNLFNKKLKGGSVHEIEGITASQVISLIPNSSLKIVIQRKR